MKKCPACDKWTLDFDEYFGRFRCYSPECGWMPASTAERELSLLGAETQPTPLPAVQIPELGLTVSSSYDREHDALSVDLGLDEPTFDLPEPDGRMIWKIGYRTDRVVGFTILGANKWRVSTLKIELIARRYDSIKQGLQRTSGILASGRVTKDVLDQIVVTAYSEDQLAHERFSPVDAALRQVIDSFQKLQPA
jgi:hypothetical protein